MTTGALASVSICRSVPSGSITGSPSIMIRLTAAAASSNSASGTRGICSMMLPSIHRRAREYAQGRAETPQLFPSRTRGTAWVLLVLGLLLHWQAGAVSLLTAAQPAAARLGARELAFEPGPDARNTTFLARGRNYQFLLSPTEVRFALFRMEPPSAA